MFFLYQVNSVAHYMCLFQGQNHQILFVPRKELSVLAMGNLDMIFDTVNVVQIADIVILKDILGIIALLVSAGYLRDLSVLFN